MLGYSFIFSMLFGFVSIFVSQVVESRQYQKIAGGMFLASVVVGGASVAVLVNSQ